MKLDDVKKLHQKKYRSQFGFYLVEGEHLIQELQRSPLMHQAITVYVTDAWQARGIELDKRFEVITVSERQMALLSDTKTPQGVIAKVPIPAATIDQPADSPVRSIYLHEVQDPGNLGTILRSLAWFNGFRLLLSPNSVDPFNSKAVRASMGAIFHLPIELDVSLAQLEARYDRFAYLDLNGNSITDSAFAAYPCYLFGNEARGVPIEALKNTNADAFTINGSGNIESLNLASAVGICAYQLSLASL
ncbi:TrmH family RNA methyltransferase [Alteromonas lipolytica]|uniref:rRNA methyltransferase n=1 Tax=Alteromonas lipolytica TaxID=1856405 RepID=A0A1E8F8M5_9ALTE|nr:RNA methyltransferase [Alteromonas lipolytica]OFI32260.1 rRNA methyltransferase [Alteromonas lipolytica]GGF86018.1 putative tRNA/rRNA methyltransferase [Alteromonas lipolytica]